MVWSGGPTHNIDPQTKKQVLGVWRLSAVILDLQIGFNSRFLTEMLNNLGSEEVSLAMSLPNRAGILTPSDGLDEGENILMLVMPVMLNG